MSGSNLGEGEDQTPGRELDVAMPAAKKAAISFILLTLFIDILGIGIVIPVLPELIKQFVEPAGGEMSNELASAALPRRGESVPVSGQVGEQPERDSLGEEDPEVTSVVDLPLSQPTVTSELHSRAGWYVGIIGATYSLTQFVFAPIIGALSDRFGRRPVILASLLGFSIDFCVQGLAPNITWLFLGRFIAGITGASFSTANAYIADVSTPETRARNFGLVGMMFGLGFILGPSLGGLLGAIHIRLPFFASAVLALLNCVYGFFVLPESLPPDQRSNLTITKINPFGTIGRLKAFPIVGGLAAAFVCLSLAQRGLENVWVIFTSYRFGWNELTNGLMLALVGVMAVIVQGGLVRPTIRRLGERRTIIVGICISMIAFFGYGIAWLGWMVPCIIVLGAFGGVTQPAIQSIVAGAVPPSEQGKVQGALTSLVSLTNIIAPLFFTAGLFSYFTSDRAIIHLPGAPFLVGSCLMLAALVIVIGVFKRYPERVALTAPSPAPSKADSCESVGDHEPEAK